MFYYYYPHPADRTHKQHCVLFKNAFYSNEGKRMYCEPKAIKACHASKADFLKEAVYTIKFRLNNKDLPALAKFKLLAQRMVDAGENFGEILQKHLNSEKTMLKNESKRRSVLIALPEWQKLSDLKQLLLPIYGNFTKKILSFARKSFQNKKIGSIQYIKASVNDIEMHVDFPQILSKSTFYNFYKHLNSTPSLLGNLLSAGF